MAKKRMFDRAIIDTDKFMDLGMTSKGLYFLLGMEADDEGFVSYKKVMRIHGGNEDDIKVLMAKGFLISFPSGVVVITDWHKNNYLDKHRITPTEYKAEKEMLSLTDDKMYEFNSCLTSIVEKSIEESSIVENISNGTDPVVETPQEPPKKEKKVDQVAEVIKAFEVIDPKNKTYYGHKGQRLACTFLIGEYGFENTKAMIANLHAVYSLDPQPEYFPSILSPYDLKEKWVKVKNAIKRATTEKLSINLVNF